MKNFSPWLSRLFSTGQSPCIKLPLFPSPGELIHPWLSQQVYHLHSLPAISSLHSYNDSHVLTNTQMGRYGCAHSWQANILAHRHTSIWTYASNHTLVLTFLFLASFLVWGDPGHCTAWLKLWGRRRQCNYMDWLHRGNWNTMGVHHRQCVCVWVRIWERKKLAITLLNVASTPCEKGNTTEQGVASQLTQ